MAPLAGCLQIDVNIMLDPDGGATVTEKVRFSRRLLDLDVPDNAALQVAPLLEKPAFLERMKHMGKGITLVSHKVEDVEKGARQATAVYHIPDLRDLRYVSPFLATGNYTERSSISFDLFPVVEDTWYGRHAGQMAVAVKLSGKEQRNDSKDAPPPPSPQEQQILRDLAPVFRDMMTDFKIKLTFETYAPLRFRQYYSYRGMRAGTHRFDLIDFSDENLDQFGYGFLDNEEVMLELLQGKLAGPNVVANVKEHGTNSTLPVFHPGGVPEIYFRPSRQLFDRDFVDKDGKAKTLTFDKRTGPPRAADFNKDGYKGDHQSGKSEDSE
ncbi:MAG: hypothetical protein BIFFINMI_03907 [Phycisphaerae bacterium]|nr:hypothetical protein [Phycisphaerae bacterium]